MIFFSFLTPLLNWPKNSNFFKLVVLQSDSMKRNYKGFTFMIISGLDYIYGKVLELL